MSFEKVENYYNEFNEWNRLNTPEGILEFDITMEVIGRFLKPGMRVLDLGGGPGRYTIELATNGYIMNLADLSPALVEIAKEKSKGIPNIESIAVVNAVDLSIYCNESFDAVLYLGPLYHILERNDVLTSLNEVKRVLKPNGLLIAAFIPLLAGTAGIIERSIFSPSQVDDEVLTNTFIKGMFINKLNTGFQDGKYYRSEEVEEIMINTGFKKLLMRSIRGIGYKLEKGIFDKKTNDKEMYNKILEIINTSSTDYSVINTCGHAIYIGEKNV